MKQKLTSHRRTHFCYKSLWYKVWYNDPLFGFAPDYYQFKNILRKRIQHQTNKT